MDELRFNMAAARGGTSNDPEASGPKRDVVMTIATKSLPLVLCLLVSSALADPIPESLIGTWQLVSRADRDPAGALVPEPSLGAHPSGYLIYDRSNHVYVQMMAENRTSTSCETTAKADTNNLAHVGGYDAYFGSLEVDPAAHVVTHVLEGALGPADVGRRLTRRYSVEGDTLTLSMEPGGEHSRGITRTLIWHRITR